MLFFGFNGGKLPKIAETAKGLSFCSSTTHGNANCKQHGRCAAIKADAGGSRGDGASTFIPSAVSDANISRVA